MRGPCFPFEPGDVVAADDLSLLVVSEDRENEERMLVLWMTEQAGYQGTLVSVSVCIVRDIVSRYPAEASAGYEVIRSGSRVRFDVQIAVGGWYSSIGT